VRPGAEEHDWGGIMTGSTLMVVPVLVFFLVVRRDLVSGMAGVVEG
jgi:N,N'-diacetylchitobiose transport system permease protein